MNKSKRTMRLHKLRQELVDEALRAGDDLPSAEVYATTEMIPFMRPIIGRPVLKSRGLRLLTRGSA